MTAAVCAHTLTQAHTTWIIEQNGVAHAKLSKNGIAVRCAHNICCEFQFNGMRLRGIVPAHTLEWILMLHANWSFTPTETQRKAQYQLKGNSDCVSYEIFIREHLWNMGKLEAIHPTFHAGCSGRRRSCFCVAVFAIVTIAISASAVTAATVCWSHHSDPQNRLSTALSNRKMAVRIGERWEPFGMHKASWNILCGFLVVRSFFILKLYEISMFLSLCHRKYTEHKTYKQEFGIHWLCASY